MPRALAHRLPREMAVLGMIECALSFAVIYAMIQTAGAPASLPDVLPALTGGRSIALAAALTLVAGALAVAIGLYNPDLCLGRRRPLTTFFLAATVAFAVPLVLGAGIPSNSAGIQTLPMAKVLLAWLVAVTMVRLLYSFAVIRMPLSRRVLVLGDAARVGRVNARLRSRRGRIFDPVVLHAQDLSWHLLRQQRIWGVVLTSVPDNTTLDSLLECKLRGVRILGGAAFQEKYLGRIELDGMAANDLLLEQGFTAGRLPAVAKRAGDAAMATGMLILLLPLMALTALAIKADSRGPVFYRQQRIGQFDRPFTLFKFRSMTADANAGGDPFWAQNKDPRITRVGRFLRATRIDELPRLANVIRGDMSLVGPRPERPHFVAQLERAIPFYRQRAYVKPGLTGWAQVNFAHGASVEDARERLAYDLYYLKNRSILLDTAILASTLRIVLFREGAR